RLSSRVSATWFFFRTRIVPSQDKIAPDSDFYGRVQRLADCYGIPIKEAASRAGISPSMLFAYKSGKSPVTRKAVRKLRTAEIEAGLEPAAVNEEAARYGERFRSDPPLHEVRAPHEHLPPPLTPAVLRVEATEYLESLFAAAGDDV